MRLATISNNGKDISVPMWNPITIIGLILLVGKVFGHVGLSYFWILNIVFWPIALIGWIIAAMLVFGAGVIIIGICMFLFTELLDKIK